MAAYSQDLRERVLRALARGEGATSIAQRLEVSLRWVYHVKDRYERHGERGARRLGGYRRSRLAAFEARIRGWLAEQVDLTFRTVRPLGPARGQHQNHGAVAPAQPLGPDL
jgi:transposase